MQFIQYPLSNRRSNKLITVKDERNGESPEMFEDECPDHCDHDRCDWWGRLRSDPAAVQGEVAREGGDVRLLHRGDLPQDAEGSHPPTDRAVPDNSRRVAGHVALGPCRRSSHHLLLDNHLAGRRPRHHPCHHHSPRSVRTTKG